MADPCARVTVRGAAPRGVSGKEQDRHDHHHLFCGGDHGARQRSPLGDRTLLGGRRPRRVRPRRDRRGDPHALQERRPRVHRRVAHHGVDGRAGRRRHRCRADRAAHRPLRSAAQRDRVRDLVLAPDPGRRVRRERRDVHDAAVPRRARPGGDPADRAGLHERGRPARTTRHRGDPGDDRLPRRCGPDRAAGAVADRRREAGGRCSWSVASPGCSSYRSCGRGCPSRRPTCAASRAATRTPARWPPAPARCCAAATCPSGRRSASRRSWGCCSSTASTPGCPRSWARPATPSRPARGCCSRSTSGRSSGC